MRSCLQRAFVSAVAIVVFSCEASNSCAQVRASPAPQGDAAAVARRIIKDKFDETACPAVTKANRLGDGSISAVCNNGERFRVFSMQTGPMAVKCSEVARMGVAGC